MKIGITYNLKDEVTPLSVLNREHNEEYDSMTDCIKDRIRGECSPCI